MNVEQIKKSGLPNNKISWHDPHGGGGEWEFAAETPEDDIQTAINALDDLGCCVVDHRNE